MTEITLATGNPHKIDEIRAIFDATTHLPEPDGGRPTPPIRLRGLNDFPGGPFPEPAETGTTFEQNATIKALAYASLIGGWCLADDSGLEIDALRGAPGVISSHYFNHGRTDGPAASMSRAERDHANNARVLSELALIPRDLRTARFVCVMVLAKPGIVLATVRGTFEGRIGTPSPSPDRVPRGLSGFGYDPLFLVAPDFTQTSAELAPEDKNRLSHRGAAARRMLAAIVNLTGQPDMPA